MITVQSKDSVRLKSGYWDVYVDPAHPRLISLRCDPEGSGHFCPEILYSGNWAGSFLETPNNMLRSLDSNGHTSNCDSTTLTISNINLGDVADMDWQIQLVGKYQRTLQITVKRRIHCEVEAISDLPFGFYGQRHFAFWSRPDVRFGHSPLEPLRTDYSSYEERRKRRVIGYHSFNEMQEFVIHGSPMYPDLVQGISSGFHHVEQNYASAVRFGVSSRRFTGKPKVLETGKETWTLTLEPLAQGTLAPIDFRSPDKRLNRDIAAMFDGLLLSAISCDHEYFGNNPYRHASATFATHFPMRGFMITDRRFWSKTQGDLDERWNNHIRRTLNEGRISPGRLTAMMCSGVWQDRCGALSPEYGCTISGGLWVTGACLQLLKTGDMKFAAEIFPDLEQILRAYDNFDPDNDGLLESPIPGTPDSPASNYNDNICIGHKDGHMNAIAHEAMNIFASLSQNLGHNDLHSEFTKRAIKLKKAYNEQLWNAKGNHYIGWIDVTGKPHDAWYTMTNFPAVTTGIPTPEMAKRLMQSFLEHPRHHSTFAAGVNLDPPESGDVRRWGGLGNQKTLADLDDFGIWLNGGVFLGYVHYEIISRARICGGENCWQMFKDIVNQFRKDNLCGDPVFDMMQMAGTALHEVSEDMDPRLLFSGKSAYTWTRGPEPEGVGTEPYLSCGGAMLWGLYTGIFGIDPDFQGLTLSPHIPRELSGTELSIRLMGKRLSIRYTNHGDTLSTLRVDGSPLKNSNIPWVDLRDNATIECLMQD